jgi:hypothetical protein
MVHHS